MALPTQSDMLNLSFTFQGQPFTDSPANANVTLTNLAYTWQGQPFARNATGGVTKTYRVPAAYYDTGITLY